MSEENKKWYSFLWNKYLIVGALFIVWMLFFDQNSYLLHKELDDEIQELEEDITYYKKELAKQEEQLNDLEKNKDSYERLAREKYFMKKPNEDIFIIETKKDSVDNE
ncbi:septum formation initiator family protein [Weeksellaceae bacterium TAE3-ERU29]|nr:septum formation initiator family protein [Weeksellaceae bacterium TAE3-ERU29]